MSTTDAAARLAALAVGLCQDAGIGLELGERHWAWDPVRRVILVPEPDLAKRGPEYCAGVLAHEIGHYFISRYGLLHVPFPSENLLPFLLNGIEDPRVNTWIRRRYPGTDTWLRAVAEEDLQQVYRPELPDVLHFVFESAREEWMGWRPASSVGQLPPAVAAALDETRPARRRYADTAPPADLDPTSFGPDLATRYRREVWPDLAPEAPRALPPPREQAVRLSAWEALRLAEEEILPVAARLLEGDIARLVSLLLREPALLREAVEAARTADPRRLELIFGRARQREAPGEAPASKPRLRQLALQLIEAWMRAWQGEDGRGQPVIGSSDETRGEVEEKDVEGKKPAKRKPAPPPKRRPPRFTSDYDRAHERVAQQVDRLTKQIEEILRPVRRMHEGRGFPSGYRLDLRRLMAFEADPRLHNKLWLRKSIPARRDTAVLLLVDLSGSMRGEKSEAALAGTVLLSESLYRLGVPFAVKGFQDVVIPFCDFGDGLTPDVRHAIGQLPLEVEGRRPDGNNQPLYNDDGPCLLEAAEELLTRGESDRLLIVVSDGLPEGRRSNEADLRNAVTRLRALGPELTLIGVGLGPNTGHVNKFYPESIANVPLERFADQIGGLLKRVLLATAGQ